VGRSVDQPSASGLHAGVFGLALHTNISDDDDSVVVFGQAHT